MAIVTMTAGEQRQRAIVRAQMYRHGCITIDTEGREITHASVSLAKRHSRARAGLGRCVAQQRGEDLFSVMRQRVADMAAATEVPGNVEPSHD